MVKYVSYILPNNVVSPKSLRSSQTLVYISSLPVDGDNTTESLKDIIPCLKGACWSENWGNSNPRFLQVIFLKADRIATPKPEIQRNVPNINYGHPQKFTEGELNSVYDVVTKS